MEIFGFDLIFGRAQKGIKPPHWKFTKEKKTEKMPLPDEVVIPLSQHIGAPCKAVVKMRDEVKVGQVVGEAGGFVSAPIHSTVSGKVKKMGQMVHLITGRVIDTVIIESDGKDEWGEPMEPLDPDTASNDDLLARVNEAGIVGLGGATFPTRVKLSPPPGKVIDTIIINGCECEPYITSDHRLMLEEGDKILGGIKVLMKVLSCDKVLIAIEDNKPDAIAHMEKLVSKEGLASTVEVKSLPSKYPMGAEKTLAKILLGKEVPIGALPFEIGALIQNVSTMKAIYDAVFKGIPLVERTMTVTGEVKDPKNLLVRFGTPIRTIIDHCGGLTEDAGKVIFGGAMMGLSQFDLDSPVIKGTNCILVKKAEHWVERDCIGCSRCITACPMNLVPTHYVKLVKAKKFLECDKYFIDNCVECGSCTYSCPAKIPLVQYIKVGKAEAMKIKRREG